MQSLVDAVGSSDLRDPRHLFNAVRRAFPKAAPARKSKFTPLPAVELEDGTLAVSGPARVARWRAHFAAQELGREVAPATYTNLATRATVHIRPPFDWSLVPTLAEVEQSVLRLRRGKASGHDGITAELLKLQAACSTRHLLPVFAKSLLALQEPVEFKGGSLFTLAKRASTAFSCDRHRSIMISSIPGKLFHLCVRRRLLPLLRSHGHDLQGGVRPGVGVDSISLAVRAFQTYAQASHLAPGLVFFDVKAAYYQIVRETLTRAAPDDRVICALMHRLRVPAAAMTELSDHLQRLNHIADFGGSAHLEAVVEELFVGTWFRLDRHCELVYTSAGVRPGDPLADILFALSFSAYIRSVEQSLAERHLSTVLPPCRTPLPIDALNQPCPLTPASWADDFAAMTATADHSLLVDRVVAIVSCFLTHATTIGMQLSFAVDKTAALLPPSVYHSHHPAFVPGGPSGAAKHVLVWDDVTHVSHQLPIVQVYKHLGGIVANTCSVLPEVHYRFSQCTWTMRPLRASLFGNPAVPLPLRRRLLGALVATKFTFGSATLELHASSHWRLWARLYTSIWKALFPRGDSFQKVHSYDVLRTGKALSPPLALAKTRAGFYLRTLECGPSTLLHLLWLQWEACPARAWLTHLEEDLQHLLQYNEGIAVLTHSDLPLRALTEAILSDRGWWRRQIAAASRAYFADLDRWHSARPCQLSAPTAPPSPSEDAFQCPFCSSCFPLRKHLGTHVARRHGYFAPARLLAYHPTCVACLRFFHSISRLQRHLKGSRGCLLRTSLLVPPMGITEVHQVEAADRANVKKLRQGFWQLHGSVPPVLQTYGPPQPSREELLSYLEDEAPLTLLGRPLRDPALEAWVQSEIPKKTSEPPRPGTCSFWAYRIGRAPARFT